MALSALIHKSKSGHLATLTLATNATQSQPPAPTVAKVATVTVAKPTESKNPELLVIVWTPAENPMVVEARDVEHAAFLVRMNPNPYTL
jgi:hypothetical protein